MDSEDSEDSEGQIKVGDDVGAPPMPIHRILSGMRYVRDYSFTTGLPETAISPP